MSTGNISFVCVCRAGEPQGWPKVFSTELPCAEISGVCDKQCDLRKAVFFFLALLCFSAPSPFILWRLIPAWVCKRETFTAMQHAFTPLPKGREEKGSPGCIELPGCRWDAWGLSAAPRLLSPASLVMSVLSPACQMLLRSVYEQRAPEVALPL